MLGREARWPTGFAVLRLDCLACCGVLRFSRGATSLRRGRRGVAALVRARFAAAALDADLRRHVTPGVPWRHRRRARLWQRDHGPPTQRHPAARAAAGMDCFNSALW